MSTCACICRKRSLFKRLNDWFHGFHKLFWAVAMRKIHAPPLRKPFCGKANWFSSQKRLPKKSQWTTPCFSTRTQCSGRCLRSCSTVRSNCWSLNPQVPTGLWSASHLLTWLWERSTGWRQIPPYSLLHFRFTGSSLTLPYSQLHFRFTGSSLLICWKIRERHVFQNFVYCPRRPCLF